MGKAMKMLCRLAMLGILLLLTPASTRAGSSASAVRGTTVSLGTMFRDPRHAPLEVALAFTQAPSGGTLVRSVAYTIALPPPATLVPGLPNAVTILAYRPLATGQLAASTPSASVIVRDAQSIRTLQRHLNSLPPPQGPMSCPADNGSHDELLFAYPDGHRLTVEVDVTGCRFVHVGSRSAWAGQDQALFDLLDTLLARLTTPLGVAAAISLCHAHPSSQARLWVRGWFVPAILGYGYVEGGLFDSRRAVPATVTNRWDVNGRWKRYGALYVHIGTLASFGARTLALHGRLDCASLRVWSDRDPFPPPQLKPVYGTAQRGRTGTITWANADGLKLTLTVPRRSYPLDALARVSVSIQNVSTHDIGYWITGISLPGVASPQAEVLDSSGKVVFPPAMPYMPALPGPAPALEPLHPGQTIGMSEYIVVRGPRICASQRFTPRLPRSMTPAASTLVTRPITVRLTAELPPALVLHQSAGGPEVEVVRPPNVRGQPLKLNYADCGAPMSMDYSYSWVPAGLRLDPGCTPLRTWHVRFAWLNHPVAGIDYTPPQPASTPTR